MAEPTTGSYVIEKLRERKRQEAERARRRRGVVARQPVPSYEPTHVEIAWAAGFFQGEGSVRVGGGAQVAQVERDPLDRLAELFGGRVRLANRRTSAGNEYFVWTVTGDSGRRFARLVGPWLVGTKSQQLVERST